jgi:hypothetical protein
MRSREERPIDEDCASDRQESLSQNKAIKLSAGSHPDKTDFGRTGWCDHPEEINVRGSGVNRSSNAHIKKLERKISQLFSAV